MTDTLKNTRMLLAKILRHTNLSKEDIIAVCESIHNKETANDIVAEIEKSGPDLPQQQMLNMCGQIIKKNLQKQG